MAVLNEVMGDLIASDEQAIAHGCNCQGFMGGGFAAQVAQRWPDLDAEYRRQCQAGEFKLGSFFAWKTSEGRIVYNLATQEVPGADARPASVAESVSRVLEDASVKGIGYVGMPRIGSGIGGLEWFAVKSLLSRSLCGQFIDRYQDLQPSVIAAPNSLTVSSNFA